MRQRDARLGEAEFRHRNSSVDHLHETLGDQTLLGQSVDDGIDSHLVVSGIALLVDPLDTDQTALDIIALHVPPVVAAAEVLFDLVGGAIDGRTSCRYSV